MAKAVSPTEPQWVGSNYDVRTYINYFPPDIGSIIGPSTVPTLKTFHDQLPSGRMMTVTNISGRENAFKIDRNGFEIVALPPRFRDVATDSLIESDFYPELDQIIKRHTGASFVYPLGHLLRRTTNEVFFEKKDSERYSRYGAPLPHCDCPVSHPERLLQFKELALRSPPLIKSGYARLARQVDKDSSRWAIVQVWKPLKTLDRDPLALCDTLSYDESDWRLRSVRAPSTGYSVLTHPDGPEKHRWFYVHGMTSEQMVLFKACDSRQGQAGFTGYAGAHTSISLPESDRKPPRESIEARFLCFWVEESQELGSNIATETCLL